jgi:hypothetical protein
MTRRQIRDSENLQWTVWDVHPTQFGDARASAFVHAELEAGWLCFDRQGERRRLAPIPIEWGELDDRALLRLLAAATPVTQWPAHGVS